MPYLHTLEKALEGPELSDKAPPMLKTHKSESKENAKILECELRTCFPVDIHGFL